MNFDQVNDLVEKRMEQFKQTLLMKKEEKIQKNDIVFVKNETISTIGVDLKTKVAIVVEVDPTFITIELAHGTLYKVKYEDVEKADQTSRIRWEEEKHAASLKSRKIVSVLKENGLKEYAIVISGGMQNGENGCFVEFACGTSGFEPFKRLTLAKAEEVKCFKEHCINFCRQRVISILELMTSEAEKKEALKEIVPKQHLKEDQVQSAFFVGDIVKCKPSADVFGRKEFCGKIVQISKFGVTISDNEDIWYCFQECQLSILNYEEAQLWKKQKQQKDAINLVAGLEKDEKIAFIAKVCETLIN